MLFSKQTVPPNGDALGQAIQQLFEAQVERTPEAIAVGCANLDGAKAEITYQELNRRANQVAHYLRRLGLGPEGLVGIYLERSPEMIVALLGVLKAGGAYVPLDITYPQERLAFMLEDSGVSLLLTRTDLRPTLPAQAPPQIICLDADRTVIARHSEMNPLPAVTAENLAYVIYTSGSTGRAKGVMIEHRALVNLTEMTGMEYNLGPGDRVLQFASISWDTSAEEIYPTLTRGATLVLRPERMLDPAGTFWQMCRAWELTVLNLPTAYWHELVAEMAAGPAFVPPPTLRLLIIGGEKAFPDRLLTWYKQAGSQIRLVNTYGLTEATAVATLGDLSRPGEEALERQTVPIGRPMGNVEVYILDDNLTPAPVGEIGELYIGGAGVGRGYLNRPELTAEKFIPNPFNTNKKLRIKNEELRIEDEETNLNQPDFSFLIFNSSLLYKTGDLARYRRDGMIELIGRADDQIKLRGYRIELGEIEAALRSHPAVREAVVALREGQQRQKRLVAYVVPEVEGSELRGDALRRYLRTKLPEYMMPSAFMLLVRLPLTPNGKVDRRALPEPAVQSPEETYMGPRSETEQRVAQIWADLLELERVGVNDHFLDLGGHSLLATQLISRLRDAFQIELSPDYLFEAGTIAQVAQYIETIGWVTRTSQQLERFPASTGEASERGHYRDEGEL
jgi:amino acid adenylation domain-containing protein